MNLMRCDKGSRCENCEHVTVTGGMIIALQAARHSNTDDVRAWNQCLADYPCLNWDAEQLALHNEILQDTSEAVRPRIETTPECSPTTHQHDRVDGQKPS
jgi:hypothetical protein